MTGPEGRARGRPPARDEILRGGRLGGVEPEVLAERFGTPLYVYDLDVVDRQVAALRAALPPAMELAYAVKANPALAVVAHLGAQGLGADIASAGELELALRAGIDPGTIVMTGPGKRDDELRLAAAAGIRAITVESPGELARLDRVAAELGRVVPVLLRASVSAAAGLERVRLVGDEGAGKFGMDVPDLVRSARLALRSRHLDLLGVHAFGASNVTDAQALADHVEDTLKMAALLAGRLGFDLRLVDVGGGLGIPYEPDDRALDLAALGDRLRRIAQSLEADDVTRRTRVLVEPGRFLVGPAGAFLARVVDRKIVGGAHVVIVDGGVHQLLRPALVGQEHRVRVLGRSGGWKAKAFPVTVAGPLCTGLDILAAHAVLPLPAVGDLVAVLDVGAYGFTESMPFFLSHPTPAEVAIRDGEAALIRRRIEPTEWLDRQTILRPVRRTERAARVRG
ncbi:MAG TPA: diaminopimelate decarboxylase [Candidatus Binatia bacterium]|nr:diaminopimelate decarboxylase [Candidatus Binatia bacterium]